MNVHNYIHISVPIYYGINKLMNIHNKITEYIKKERVVTSSEISKILDISWNTAEKYLLELVIEGKIEKIKKLGVNLWLLK